MKHSDISHYLSIVKNIDNDFQLLIWKQRNNFKKEYLSIEVKKLVDFIDQFDSHKDLFIDVLETAIYECLDISLKHFAISEVLDIEDIQEFYNCIDLNDYLWDTNRSDRSISIESILKEKRNNPLQ
jgi:hypothetical protein